MSKPATATALISLLTVALSPVHADDWPQFLGPERSGHSKETIAAPKGAAKILWQRQVGAGFAGPAVAGDRLILHHRVGNQSRLEAMDVKSGKTLWQVDYSTGYRDDFGFDEGPRSTPTIDGGSVFAYGAEGQIHAVSVADGKSLWSVDTRKELGSDKGFFGSAGSPLVVGDKLVVPVGGRRDAGVVAFDVDTGNISWQSTDDEASYSSPVRTKLAGEDSVLVWTRDRLVDLDPENGDLRRAFPFRARMQSSINAATPLVIDGKVFLSAVYGVGAVLLEPSADGFEPVWADRNVFSNHYATSVYHEGYLYGFHGAIHTGGASLRCIELATGKLMWDVQDIRSGSVLVAGHDLVVLPETGELVIGKASPQGFKAAHRSRILRPEVRAAPALSNGVLYARDPRQLVAIDLRP